MLTRSLSRLTADFFSVLNFPFSTRRHTTLIRELSRWRALFESELQCRDTIIHEASVLLAVSTPHF